MDDDLRALLGDDFDDDSNDDLFVEFDASDDDFFSDDLFDEEEDNQPITAPSVPVTEDNDEWDDLPPAPTEPVRPDEEEVPAWLSDAPEEAPAPPAPAGKVQARTVQDDSGKEKPQKKRRRRNFLGMTPFQRMILSIFFFLDVLVIGFLLLVALGRITF